MTPTPSSAGAHDAFHARARDKGVNPLVYWLARAVLQPFFHLYFRMSRIGREHVPDSGPVILCANHRSFLDPFVIGTIVRRPVYYVAKQELFRYRVVAWFLSSLGAFPVVRGAGDQDMMTTAKAILDRGDAVLIFAEGTRIRPGALGRPKRGVGRLALETGAPVVPLAVFGTEAVRKGWRIRPHKVRIRVGSPLTFPKVEHASPQLAAAVTDRIWPNVMLQWEWLGGLPPLRRAAVIGAGAWGTTVAAMLARAGVQVDLGTLRGEDELHGVELPHTVRRLRAGDLELSRHDLVCFASPAAALPAVVAERTESWAVGALGGAADPPAALVGSASLVFAATDAGFRRQVTDALAAAGFDVAATSDVVGVELAGVAADAAALAVAAAAPAGPNAAGSAAGKVFAEVEAYARTSGAAPGTFAGLAGAGDLVATVLAGDRHPVTAAAVPLLADRVTSAGLDAPVLRGLAGVIDGSVAPDRWTASLTAPRPREHIKVA